MFNMRGESERFYLNLGWGQVHGRHAGTPGKPAIVFIHQSPLSSASYEPVIPLLASQGKYAVALDTPGFGMSDLADSNWSIFDYAREFWCAVDELGLSKIDIVGQHTGAVIGVEAYLQQPGRVNHLVLQGLPFYDDAERAEKKLSWAPGYVLARDGSHLVGIWNRIFEIYPQESLERADRQVLEYLSTGPDYGTAYRGVFNYDIDVAALQNAPLRFLMGDGDLLNRMQEKIRKEFPAAPYRVIPETTDFSALEKPQEFVSLLLESLE
jgi:pimeloyl-ACP methyl ester carboxylesterase